MRHGLSSVGRTVNGRAALLGRTPLGKQVELPMERDRSVRIYVSALYTGEPGFSVKDRQATELLHQLKDAGYDVYWEQDFRGYPIIEQEIADSDAMLVIMDTYWWSSTWMAIEVTWAYGYPPSDVTTKSIP